MRVLQFTASAERELASLPLAIQTRFARAIPKVLEDPFRPRPGVDIRPLRGRTEWRLRIGHYRASYEVGDDSIVFVRFGHRSTFYR